MELETMTFSKFCTQDEFNISQNEEQKTQEVAFQNRIEISKINTSTIGIKYLYMMVFLVEINLKRTVSSHQLSLLSNHRHYFPMKQMVYIGMNPF